MTTHRRQAAPTTAKRSADRTIHTTRRGRVAGVASSTRVAPGPVFCELRWDWTLRRCRGRAWTAERSAARARSVRPEAWGDLGGLVAKSLLVRCDLLVHGRQLVLQPRLPFVEGRPLRLRERARRVRSRRRARPPRPLGPATPRPAAVEPRATMCSMSSLGESAVTRLRTWFATEDRDPTRVRAFPRTASLVTIRVAVAMSRGPVCAAVGTAAGAVPRCCCCTAGVRVQHEQHARDGAEQCSSNDHTATSAEHGEGCLDVERLFTHGCPPSFSTSKHSRVTSSPCPWTTPVPTSVVAGTR